MWLAGPSVRALHYCATRSPLVQSRQTFDLLDGGDDVPVEELSTTQDVNANVKLLQKLALLAQSSQIRFGEIHDRVDLMLGS